jgi:hypothetical protein
MEVRCSVRSCRGCLVTTRRTWLIVLGPAVITDHGRQAATGLLHYHLASPSGFTLDVHAADPVDEAELRHLGGCWFRDNVAEAVLARASQAGS